MIGYGHKPVFIIVPNAEFIKIQQGKVPVWSQKWQRITADVNCKRGREGLVVAFEFTLAPEFKSNDHILFAYAQPFTRTDIERSTVEFEA